MTTKPNVGDIVHVRAKVIGIDRDDSIQVIYSVHGVFEWSCSRAWVENSSIVHIEPRPLAVGDRIGPHGVIKAIDGEWAWVKYGDDCHSTESIHKLRRHQP
jgi:hypothetical protein